MNHQPGSARETLVASLGADPYDGIELLRKAGERKARAEGVAYELDHQRHIVLSQIMNELAVVHAKEKMAEAKLDRMARADPRYAAHVKRTAEAMAEKERAISEYFAIKSELEWDGHSLFHINALSRLDR